MKNKIHYFLGKILGRRYRIRYYHKNKTFYLWGLIWFTQDFGTRIEMNESDQKKFTARDPFRLVEVKHDKRI